MSYNRFISHVPARTDDSADLAKSELWTVDLGWSTQAETLRTTAIHTPSIFSLEHAIAVLRHLRIIDKEVIH